MTLRKLVTLVIGITCSRILMACPYSTIQAENGTCVDCPAGYFGKNCSGVCSGNTYGVGCFKICKCYPENCDPKIGCIQLSSTTKEATERKILQTDPVIFNLLLIVLVIAGCHFLLTVIRVIRKWRQHKERRQTGNVADSSSNKSDNPQGNEGMQREVFELPSDEYEPQIIPTERPANNVYTGIRIV